MTGEEVLRRIWRAIDGIAAMQGKPKPSKIKINPALYETLKAERDNLVIPMPVRYLTIFGIKYEVDDSVKEFEIIY